MNQVVTTDPHLERAVETGRSVGLTTAQGTKLAPESLGEVIRFAEIMSKAGMAIPAHLRNEPGACMAVAMQALEWNMSPFAVASKSYAVNGIIAYEAQLIAAVVNTRSGIQGRLKYRFEGTGEDLKCFVTGIVDGDELVYESPAKRDIKPQNSPLWKTDPQQQLSYYSARAWARRHTPEVLLGVYDREEAQDFRGPDNARDVTPTIPLKQRLEEANASDSGEGFSQEYVETETAKLKAEEPEQEPAVDAQHAAEASEDDDLPSEPSDATDPQVKAEDDEPSFPGDGPSDKGEPELCPVDRYVDLLQSMGEAKDVHELTNEFMNDISALPQAKQNRAEKARQKRLKAIAEDAING